MTFFERIEQLSGSLTASALTGLLGGGAWVIRRVFTNQKQIELLQQEIKLREERRQAENALITKAIEDTGTEITGTNTRIDSIFKILSDK